MAGQSAPTGIEKASTGAFLRGVAITAREVSSGTWQARAAIEDDFHHFRVIVDVHDGIITGARSVTLRQPNNFCEAAGGRLAELVGKPLSDRAASVMAYTDARQQCTHQFDIAALSVAAITNRRALRRYGVCVPDRVDGRTCAWVERDGEEVLRWNIDGSMITGPGVFAGRDIGSGFTAFVQTLDKDEAEAALVLRRAVFVSIGRKYAIGELSSRGPVGGCWAWQPERVERLVRNPDSRQDFTGRPDALLAQDKAWLAFEE